MRVQVVFVSKDDTFAFSRDSAEELERKDENVQFAYVSRNKLPLADVYNEFILQARAQKDIDCLILMHADVKLDFDQLFKQIEDKQDQYDAFGLCGCAKINLSMSPLNWYTGSTDYPEFRWGSVITGEIGDHMSFFSKHHPDATDHEVACIDGLCIGLLKKALYSSSILFDPQFSFNQYDTDFSLQCVLKEKLKLGVLVRKDLYHYSLGRSILDQSFLDGEKKLRDKWADFIK